MTLPTLLAKVVAALRKAGTTEEITAAAVKAGGEFCDSPPHRGGRPRKHADGPARQRAYRRRYEIRYEIQPPRDQIRNEIPIERPPDAGRSLFRLVPIEHLRRRLLDAAQGHFDLSADVAPIRALVDQGCDLEADVVPIVAREVPELPRPLKNWGDVAQRGTSARPWGYVGNRR